MLRDLRYAIRILLRSKGYAAVAVLALALGIGANTAAMAAVALAASYIPARRAARLDPAIALRHQQSATAV